MRCRDLFVMQHPETDLEMTILKSCPHDFGLMAKEGDLCMQDRTLGLQDCRKCWEQEAVE